MSERDLDAEQFVDDICGPIKQCYRDDAERMSHQYNRGVCLRGVKAGHVLGLLDKITDCETCGCSGVMSTVVGYESDGRDRREEMTCGECEGTGVGEFGQMLADVKAMAYRDGEREGRRVGYVEGYQSNIDRHLKDMADSRRAGVIEGMRELLDALPSCHKIITMLPSLDDVGPMSVKDYAAGFAHARSILNEFLRKRDIR